MKLLHHGIRTCVLVCDGGSLNIAMIKVSYGCHGAYSIQKNGDDRLPWMINLYDLPNKFNE